MRDSDSIPFEFLSHTVPKAYKSPEFVEELRAILTEQGTVSRSLMIEIERDFLIKIFPEGFSRMQGRWSTNPTS